MVGGLKPLSNFLQPLREREREFVCAGFKVQLSLKVNFMNDTNSEIKEAYNINLFT